MTGLKYKKLDLHMHTPGSKCYLNKGQTSNEIVQAALTKELAGIAVTDHNTAEWIDSMKKAAEGTGLVVFPGVEISLNEGYHLVALFDPSVNQKYVESFLGLIKITPEEYGKSETLCKLGVYEVIKLIHERQGLAVLAHIDMTKGAFYEMTETVESSGKVKVPVNCSNLFNDQSYDAIECVKGEYPKGFDADHQIKRCPPFYQASDNPEPEQPKKHSMAGLGSLYSWFHMDTIDLEGLRQCFSDPQVRIRLMDDFKIENFPHILSMKISEQGFLRNQKFEFHPGLNSIIGGKGVGKSLSIEFLRYVLGQPPSDKSIFEDHLGKLETRLEAGNTVEVLYQSDDGVQYQISRTYNGKDKSSKGFREELKCINLSTDEEFKGDLRVICPVLAYSQMEVVKIAENKSAQLELIDRFIDTRSQERKIEELKTRLHENDQDFDRAIQAKSQLESYEHELNTISEQIKKLDRSLKDPLFEKMKKAEAKKEALEEQNEFAAELVKMIRQWQTQVIGAYVPEASLNDLDVKEQNKILAEERDRIMSILSKLTVDVKAVQKKVNTPVSAWETEYTKLETDFNKLLSKMGGDKESLDRQRKRLNTQKTKLDSNIKEASALVKNLDASIDARNKMLDDLERAYREYYEIRKTKFDELSTLSDAKLKLDLVHAGNRESYIELIMDLLKGGANAITSSDRRKIAENVLPRRFVDLVLNRNGIQLANDADITENIAGKVIEKLWSADSFTDVLALQYNCYPEDVPAIRYRKEGGVYAELNELSVGQKSTALLIIALCDGKMPVIIDQPEDALDNVSVWEDVSKKLRRGKINRQFILTTHNPTVSVGSDSDQYIVMDATANQGRIKNVGSIDTRIVRDDLIHHLEGGDEPYKLRSRKYNIKDTN
jgi:DNA repair ATPase RecN